MGSVNLILEADCLWRPCAAILVCNSKRDMGSATNRPNGYEVGETIEIISFPFTYNVIENITTPTHSVDFLLSPRYPRCSKQRWRLSEEAQRITSAIEGENGAVGKVFREKPST